MFATAVLLSVSAIVCYGQSVKETWGHMVCGHEKPCIFAYNLVFPMDGTIWPYESTPVNFAPCPRGCEPKRTLSAIVFCEGHIWKCADAKDKKPCVKAWCICEYWFTAWLNQLAPKDSDKRIRKFYFKVHIHNPPYQFGCRENDPYNPCSCKKEMALWSDHCYLDIFTCVPITCVGKFDLNFVVDTSGSINDEEFGKAKGFIKSVIGQMDISSTGIHVSLTNYATTATQEFCLLDKFTATEVVDAVENMQQKRKGTNTHIGLQEAAKCARKDGRKDVPQIIVVLTDGASSFRSLTKAAADSLKAEGFLIIAVGIGSETGSATDKFRQELDNMATPPASENSLFVDGFDKLLAITDKLTQAICDKQTK